ncbi:MAG: hypothetical protein IPJ13_10215 [Saprospiraceae bacterium]|nr:hypothetical protein [Saprospiraceae bacterium]
MDINRGPTSSTGGYAGVGRLNCVAFHPSDLIHIGLGHPGWTVADYKRGHYLDSTD